MKPIEPITLLKDPITGNDIPEIWKTIQAIPNYKISSYGRVIGMRGRLLRLSKNKKGYYILRMENVNYSKSIHRTVAVTFFPTDDESLTVNHKDGNKTNNHVSNLEWCTRGDNVRHAIQTGLRTAKSNLQGNDIFTRAQVIAIKEALFKGYKGRHISNYFKCSETTISKIKVGKHYPHIAI